MYTDLVGEGWDDPQELREAYKPVKDEDGNPQRLIDGVITVTSKLEAGLTEKVNLVKEHFLKEPGNDPDNYIVSNDPVIEFPLIREGKARDGKKEQ